MSSAASSLSTTADRRGRRSVMSRLAALVAAVVGTMACCATVAHGTAPATLQLGSQMLDKCADSPLAYCGRLPVPLDHARPAGPHISIAFRWYPASAPVHGAARRTVVPVEGGPGYPSIESVSRAGRGADPRRRRVSRATVRTAAAAAVAGQRRIDRRAAGRGGRG